MKLAVLVALTLAGGILRFTAVDFGLPDKFRPDEEYLVSRAVGFTSTTTRAPIWRALRSRQLGADASGGTLAGCAACSL